MNEDILQQLSDFMENPQNSWMVDIFSYVSPNTKFLIIDAISDAVENRNIPIEDIANQVFLQVGRQVGMIRWLIMTEEEIKKLKEQVKDLNDRIEKMEGLIKYLTLSTPSNYSTISFPPDYSKKAYSNKGGLKHEMR